MKISRRGRRFTVIVAALIAGAWVSVSEAALAEVEVLDADTLMRLELFSGRIAVLPPLPGQNLADTPVGSTLVAAGAWGHCAVLSPEQMVDTNQFTPDLFPVAIYLGGEPFWQTVRRTGDAYEALRGYLHGGGTLLVLPSGPFPFYYNQAGQVAGGAAALGLSIGGFGFETQPAGRAMTFHLNTNQGMFRLDPPKIPYPDPSMADQRWRASTDPKAPNIRYIPVLSLRDDRGQAYGDGLAVLEHTAGPLAGGREVCVWFSLLADDLMRARILKTAFQYALAGRTPPPAMMECRRLLRSPVLDGRLDDPAWQPPAPSTPFRLAGVEPRQPPQPVQFRARWDDRHVYLAFDRASSAGGDKTQSNDRLQVWYLPPQADRVPKGLAIRPGALAVSATWPPGSAASGSPTPEVQCVQQTNAGRWTSELAIPWSWFEGAGLPVKQGRELRMQCVLFTPQASAGSAGSSCWSTTENLSLTNRFGRLLLCGDPLADDFEVSGDPAAPGSGWQCAAGKWRVEQGVLVGEGCGGDAFEIRGAQRGDRSWRDYRFEVRFKVDSRASDWRDGPWFGIRCRPDGDGYYLTFTDRDVQLHKTIYGLSTAAANPLATASLKSDDKWHALQVQVVANRFAVTLDGRMLFEAKDDAHLFLPSLRSGGIILAARQSSGSQGRTVVRFDDVVVTLLPDL